MTPTRLIGLTLALVLVLRILPAVTPFLGPQWRGFGRKLGVVIDVAGGLIILAIATSAWLRGNAFVGLIVLALGIPVFVGTCRALPAWWRGDW